MNRSGLNAIADSSGRIVLQNPLPGKRGTLGQRSVIGPGSWTLDGSLSKSFRIAESKQIQLRFDATNVLNHPDPFAQAIPQHGVEHQRRRLRHDSRKGNQRRSFQGQLRFTF